MYRKKPVVVEAVQWTGENHAEMCEFIDPEVFEIIPRVGLVIHTLEGDHHANPGDYIIKGVNGEFYPCKPDIFAKTYENSTLTQPNEPLTLEELSLCNDPVWIKRNADRNLSDDGWAIVEGPRCLTWHDGIPVSWGIRVWWPGSEVEDYPKYENYGKTWLAYRRPPEEEV